MVLFMYSCRCCFQFPGFCIDSTVYFPEHPTPPNFVQGRLDEMEGRLVSLCFEKENTYTDVTSLTLPPPVFRIPERKQQKSAQQNNLEAVNTQR